MLYIGIIGLLLLVIGWIPETLKIIKEKKAKIDPKFGVLYVLGSLFLAIYSYQIMDYVFLALNIFVMIMSGVSLYYSLKK